MFFRKQEKKRMNPWCVIIVGGLAVVGAVSLTNKGRELIRDKTRAVAALFKGKGTGCDCTSAEEC